MDLLLSHGYFLNEDETERRVMKPYPPLGILYLSSYLKLKGFDVRIFDSTFHSKAEFRRHIDAEAPGIIGLYTNLMTKLNILDQIRYCGERGWKVIVGGPDVPEYAPEYIRHGADVAVFGEGERTMEELLPALTKGAGLEHISGIAYRGSDGTIRRTPAREMLQDLDALPLPDRESIDIQKYVTTWKTHHGMGSLSLICARGCPFTCTWCSRSVFGESHRRRSVKSVVDEIEILRDTYRPDMLWFADDVFTIQHKWIHEFYKEMKRRNLRIPFECISRADRLSEEILKMMAELGAFRIWYGSESGSQRILDAMQRRVSVEEIREVTRLARNFGIQTGLFVMLGYPGEKLPDIEATVSHLKLTNADQFLTTVAYPIKGTDFYREAGSPAADNGAWERGSDRNLPVHGRYSDRFYWFANRYVVNEVRQHQLRRNNSPHWLSAASSFVKAKVARAGMEFTKGAVS
jgi:radical SAM superfamily enzyme YgiQ (UPF0313 family)